MEFTPLNETSIRELLQRGRDALVAVLGDYCLDIYWDIDLSRSEPSLETGIPTHPVHIQRYALGGAGNVANNLAALGCGQLYALGVVGDDPWGKELVKLLVQIGADTAGIIIQPDDLATLAYTKPHIGGVEQNRMDFGNFNRLSDATVDTLLGLVRKRLLDVDIVVVNEQVREGIHNARFREGLLGILRANGEKVFIVDSRHYSDVYQGAHLKINDHEAARLCGSNHPVDALVSREGAVSAAETLVARNDRPVFVTRGSRGMVVSDCGGVTEIPGVRVAGPVDTVGAGDSALAGISIGLAAGAEPAAAAQLGNLAAAVTIKKLQQTGTASPDEVVMVGRGNGSLHH